MTQGMRELPKYDDDHADPDFVFRLLERSQRDRRTARRFGVDLHVTLASGEDSWIGRAENLSDGGVFVAARLNVPIGSVIEVCIAIPELDRCVVGLGEVRWRRTPDRDDSEGFGLRFVSIARGGSGTLDEFLGRLQQ